MAIEMSFRSVRRVRHGQRRAGREQVVPAGPCCQRPQSPDGRARHDECGHRGDQPGSKPHLHRPRYGRLVANLTSTLIGSAQRGDDASAVARGEFRGAGGSSAIGTIVRRFSFRLSCA